MKNFALCSHQPTSCSENFPTFTENVCESCSKDLNKASRTSDEHVASASRLCSALVNFSMSNGSRIAREISSAAADVIASAVGVRDAFFEAFESTQDEDVSSYTLNHKYGSGLSHAPSLD